jgi:hypothetical protein
MKPRPTARCAAVILAGFAAACTSTSPQAMTSDLNAGGARAPSAIAAESPGYQINGDTFSGDLIFEDRGGRPVIVYSHAVDGAPTLVAELDLERSWLADGVRRFEGLSDRGVEIEVALVSGPCLSQGRSHARFARVQAGRTTYEGCARETGPVVSWSETLPRYLPAVEACERNAATSSMAFVRGEGGHIVHARSQDGADVLRYRYGERGRWDCSVAEGRVSWSVVNSSAALLPGEGDPVFAPGRMPTAGDGCYLYERVQARDGRLLGALGQDVCTGGLASQSIAAPFG